MMLKFIAVFSIVMISFVLGAPSRTDDKQTDKGSSPAPSQSEKGAAPAAPSQNDKVTQPPADKATQAKATDKATDPPSKQDDKDDKGPAAAPGHDDKAPAPAPAQNDKRPDPVPAPSQWGNDKNNLGRRASWGVSKEDIMAKSIFDQTRWSGPAVAECPDENVGWVYKTWTAGGTRPYYVNKGYKSNFDQCLQECQIRDDCYFATYTGSQNCYLLSTSDDALCQYLDNGHFGPFGEMCTLLQPCPSAYKSCSNPVCTLVSIATIYCSKWDQVAAVTTCVDTL